MMPTSVVPPYIKKLRIYDEPGQAPFLIFSCYRRLPLLSKDRSRRWFGDALAPARLKHGFELWAWVIMPQHVHLLVCPKPGCRAGAAGPSSPTIASSRYGSRRASSAGEEIGRFPWCRMVRVSCLLFSDNSRSLIGVQSAAERRGTSSLGF
jgi:hypothetical protein